MMDRRARELTRRYRQVLDEIRQEDVAAASIAYRAFTLSSRGPAEMMDLDLPEQGGLGSSITDPLSSSPPTLVVTSEDLEHLLDLRMLRSSFIQLRSQQPGFFGLAFLKSSQYILTHPYHRTDYHSVESTNIGDSALSHRSRLNTSMIKYESDLFEHFTMLNRMPTVSDRLPVHAALHERLISEVSQALEDIDVLKEIEWGRQKQSAQRIAVAPPIAIVNTDRYFVKLFDFETPHGALINACHFLALILTLVFGLARRPTSLLLVGLQTIVRLTMAFSGGNAARTRVWKDISIDPVALIRRYSLDPTTRSYVCCPRCFALYGPDEQPPERCTAVDVDGQECCVPLYRSRTIRGKQHKAPIRSYYHQDLKEWMARFLSRPEIERLLDLPLEGTPEDGHIKDIWGGSVFRTFRGPDGRSVYLEVRSEEGNLRLVFALGVDGFNSYRNMQAKKKTTSTGIYLVCVNLPPDVRYLPENIYLVGVVPGPNKPNLDQLNPFLSLLVQDLLPFWDPGVRFTRTANHRHGRLVNAALIPLVSDLMAAHQVAGFPSPKHRFFCSLCYLTYDKIDEFDQTKWPPRTLERHLEGAKAWKEAPSSADRKNIFETYGVRWTALLDLPYWNPLLFTTIDSMHNHYLGLLQNHIRSIWGISLSSEDGDGQIDPSLKVPARPAALQMQQGRETLAKGDRQAILALSTSILWYLCLEKGLLCSKNKKKMTNDLLTWRSQHPVPVDPVASAIPSTSTSTPSSGSSTTHTTQAPEPAPARPPLSDAALAVQRMIERRLAQSAIAGKRHAVLVELCAYHGLPTDGFNKTLAARLLAMPLPQGIFVGEAQQAKKATSVLGQGVLFEVHKDMASTQLPTWLQPAPVSFGSTAGGKLSADEWRVVSTVHLTITMIRLWGGLDPDDRKKKMLDNFMHLIRAVNIAGSLRISEPDIKEYERSLLAYLRGIKELYEHARIKPNHHMAIHLTDFLRKYGPVHSWRAYAFERFNYLLQSLNTNKRFGQMEHTFMTQLCRASNLRALVRQPELQSAMGELMEYYSRILSEDPRGTRVRDAISLVERQKEKGVPSNPPVVKELSAGVLGALQSRLNHGRSLGQPLYYDERTRPWAQPGRLTLYKSGTQCDLVTIGGVRFSPERLSLRDSNVLYCAVTSGINHAGRITDIFLHKRFTDEGEPFEETFIGIRRLRQLSPEDAEKDVFRQYGKDGGYLCYDDYEDTMDVVTPQEVLCHFAWTAYSTGDGQSRVHVLLLDRLLRVTQAPRNLDEEEVQS